MNYQLSIRDYLKLGALALCMLAGGIELADPPRKPQGITRQARDEAARKLCRAKLNTGVLSDIECL